MNWKNILSGVLVAAIVGGVDFQNNLTREIKHRIKWASL